MFLANQSPETYIIIYTGVKINCLSRLDDLQATCRVNATYVIYLDVLFV